MLKESLRFFTLLMVISLFTQTTIIAQISHGGTPPSIKYKLDEIKSIEKVPSIDVEKYLAEDKINDSKGKLYRYGVQIPVDFSPQTHGTWTELPNGDKIWRFSIQAENALALALYYDDMWLPEGSELYIYNKTHDQILGSYNSSNNPPSGLWANELVQGDQVTLEYFQPSWLIDPLVLHISSIGYAYRGVHFLYKNRTFEYNSSQDCEVDVNCPEGDPWRDQQRGVARISVVHDSQMGWCSGSLVNNTQNDCKPYFLTADHCSDGATVPEVLTWVVYFNYERQNCNLTTETEPVPQTISGGWMKARGGWNGSDYYLLMLSSYLPTDYNAFLNGWRSTNSASTSGFCIHHPAGDIKKISFYTQTTQNYYNTHWAVRWSGSTNGYGVTEGGSSGSPLFNSQGEIIGTLTGGLSACTVGGAGTGTGPNEYDIYGKVSYSWDANGSTPADRLQDWLAPGAPNTVNLAGADNTCSEYPVIPDFWIEDFSIPVGTTVKYYNLTVKNPEYSTSFLWEFEGVVQSATSIVNSPQRTFNTEGVFPVTLTATSNGNSYSITKYMYVGNVGISEMDKQDLSVYPNPADDRVYIRLNQNLSKVNTIEICDMLGKKAKAQYNFSYENNGISLDVSSLPAGMYMLSVIVDGQRLSKKMIIK